MRVIERGFQKRTGIVHKCAVSTKNTIGSAEMNSIPKQKYAKSDKDGELPCITGGAALACVFPPRVHLLHAESGKWKEMLIHTTPQLQGSSEVTRGFQSGP